MIAKIKIYTLLIVAPLVCFSCLDKYPDDSILAEDALNTVDEIDQASYGLYSGFKSGALYSGYLALLPDIQADLVYAVNGYSNTYGNIWRWDILSTNEEVESVYAALYGIIARANFLLDKAEALLPKLIEDSDINVVELCQGEAYMARAIAYSELIKLFCKSYESDEDAKNELGVVLIHHYDSDEPVKRSSLYDSYQMVLDDLDKAAELLYVGDYDGVLYDYTYFCEFAAYALRSRVALYMKDYDAAIEYATKVIDSGYYFLTNANDYSYSSYYDDYQYMWATGHSTETIWKIGFTTTSYGGALGTVFFNYDYVAFYPDYVPAYWFIDSFTTYDDRPNSLFSYQTTGYSHQLYWPLLAKYYGESDFWDYGIACMVQPKVFRLSEQYLIRAEAYTQQGNLSKAAEDITTMRKARYYSGYSTSFTSQDDAMDVIESERVKELYMEGFRLQDLKRWHKGFKREPQEESLSNGSSLEIQAEDPLFVWPIPSHELESPGADIEPNESNK